MAQGSYTNSLIIYVAHEWWHVVMINAKESSNILMKSIVKSVRETKADFYATVLV